MHDIEPHWRWRREYDAARDEKSPFYGRIYDEFRFHNKVYNYFIHPQWDSFGSNTLYAKILFVEYDAGYAILELIGEWNDCVTNDIMFLKREIIDYLSAHGVDKYIAICENVLNFHGDDDSYYEEWYEDVRDSDGWIVFLNTLEHVQTEMNDTRLFEYVHFGAHYNGINWRPHKPKQVFQAVNALVEGRIQSLPAGF